MMVKGNLTMNGVNIMMKAKEIKVRKKPRRRKVQQIKKIILLSMTNI